MMIDQRLTLLMKVLALELIAYLVSHGSHGDVFLLRVWGREGVKPSCALPPASSKTNIAHDARSPHMLRKDRAGSAQAEFSGQG